MNFESIQDHTLVVCNRHEPSMFGTGIAGLFGDFVYVFTATHVIVGLSKNEVVLKYKEYEEDEFLEFNIDKIINVVKSDLSVLVLSKQDYLDKTGKLPYEYNLLRKLYHSEKYQSCGFPNKLVSENGERKLKFSSEINNSKIGRESFSSDSKQINEIANPKCAAREVVGGVSGAGVFLELDGGFWLSGVVSRLVDKSGTWGLFISNRIEQSLNDGLVAEGMPPLKLFEAGYTKRPYTAPGFYIPLFYKPINGKGLFGVSKLSLLDLILEKYNGNRITVLIVDEGGSGKTTDIEKILSELSDSHRDIFPLKILARAIEKQSVQEIVRDVYQSWSEIVSEHHLVIFIDALDDVSNNKLSEVIDHIDDCVETMFNVSFVVSTRKSGFDIDSRYQKGLNKFRKYILKLNPISITESEELITEYLSPDRTFVDFETEVDEKELRSLLGNPFFLVQAMDKFKADGSLENSASSFLEWLVEVSCKEDGANKIHDHAILQFLEGHSGHEMKIVQRLALAMYHKGVTAVTIEELGQNGFSELDFKILDVLRIIDINGTEVTFAHKLIRQHLVTNSLKNLIE